MTIDEELAEQHYAEHEGKPFFGELVDFITSGPLVAMVLEGHEAVEAARQVIGATNPLEAAPGSIRGDFAIEVGQNMVHGSDSPESAAARDRDLLPGALAGDAALDASSSPRARRSGGRSSSSWASRSRSRPADVEEVDAGDPRAVAARERAPQGAAARRQPADARPRRRHARRARRRIFGKPRRRGAGARARCGRLSGRTHEVVSGLALVRDGDARRRVAVTKVTFRDARRGLIDWYVGDRRVARPRRRLRHPGPRRRARRRASRATTSTSSACRWRRCWTSRRSCSTATSDAPYGA